MKQIETSKLNRHLTEVLEGIAQGEKFELTRYGKTVAMIVPAGKTVTAIQSADPDQLTDEQVARLEPVDIRVSPDLKVTRLPTASVPPNPKPLKPYQSPSKLVSNTELEQSFTYRPVPKPGTKK